MVVPIISSITREVMTAVPQQQREAVLALGATRWEMIRTGVLRNARAGILGGIILGLGRALGETMAVTMVIGNRPEIARSLFAPGYTMASVIANEFSEATGDLYLSALIEVGLALFHRDHHREYLGAVSGLDGDPRNAGEEQCLKLSNPGAVVPAPISLWRAWHDTLRHGRRYRGCAPGAPAAGSHLRIFGL